MASFVSQYQYANYTVGGAFPQDSSSTFSYIENGSDLVFDLDGTLKMYDPYTRTTSCPITNTVFNNLTGPGKCRPFILTAINNTWQGMRTLQLEVRRLRIQRFFAADSDVIYKQKTRDGSDVYRWGNCITCGSGFNKVDIYLECCMDQDEKQPLRPVYFFDDEVGNVSTFKALLPRSNVFHVTAAMPLVIGSYLNHKFLPRHGIQHRFESHLLQESDERARQVKANAAAAKAAKAAVEVAESIEAEVEMIGSYLNDARARQVKAKAAAAAKAVKAAAAEVAEAAKEKEEKEEKEEEARCCELGSKKGKEGKCLVQ